jgi:hypothetical protein
MPIVDVFDVTEEELDEMLAPAPKGDYLVEIKGFKTDEEGGIVQVSEAGNKMFCVYFKFVDPEHAQKNLKPYYVVDKTGLRKAFNAAFPDAVSGRSINTDVAVGLQTWAAVGTDEYEGNIQNAVKKLYPKGVVPKSKQ